MRRRNAADRNPRGCDADRFRCLVILADGRDAVDDRNRKMFYFLTVDLQAETRVGARVPPARKRRGGIHQFEQKFLLMDKMPALVGQRKNQ